MVKFPYDELSSNLSYDIQQNLLRINVKNDLNGGISSQIRRKIES